MCGAFSFLFLGLNVNTFRLFIWNSWMLQVRLILAGGLGQLNKPDLPDAN